MITREFTGKSREEVIEKALDVLKLEEDQVCFEFKDENSILPFMKKKVIAKVSFEEHDMFGNKCLMFVKDLLEKMNIEARIYLIEESDSKIIIEIESPDTAIIIGKKGQTLESIQTIANIILNKNSKTWTKVVIDIENYRNRRERNLRFIANKMANKVRNSRKYILLEPMNPFERRIIHVALQDEDDVKTESIGDGLLKKVKISYSGK